LKGRAKRTIKSSMSLCEDLVLNGRKLETNKQEKEEGAGRESAVGKEQVTQSKHSERL